MCVCVRVCVFVEAREAKNTAMKKEKVREISVSVRASERTIGGESYQVKNRSQYSRGASTFVCQSRRNRRAQWWADQAQLLPVQF